MEEAPFQKMSNPTNNRKIPIMAVASVIGAAQLAFEQLKAKLEQEGLFAVEHKKPLPTYPTVSYTHLDVYKRQSWRCSTSCSSAQAGKTRP